MQQVTSRVFVGYMVTPQDLQTFGVIAFIPILAAVIVFLYKELKSERKKSDGEKDARLVDAKEYRDQLDGPMTKMTDLTQQIYDRIIRNSQGQ